MVYILRQTRNWCGWSSMAGLNLAQQWLAQSKIVRVALGESPKVKADLICWICLELTRESNEQVPGSYAYNAHWWYLWFYGNLSTLFPFREYRTWSLALCIVGTSENECFAVYIGLWTTPQDRKTHLGRLEATVDCVNLLCSTAYDHSQVGCFRNYRQTCWGIWQGQKGTRFCALDPPFGESDGPFINNPEQNNTLVGINREAIHLKGLEDVIKIRQGCKAIGQSLHVPSQMNVISKNDEVIMEPSVRKTCCQVCQYQMHAECPQDWAIFRALTNPSGGYNFTNRLFVGNVVLVRG